MSRDVRLLVFSLFLWGLGEGQFIYIQPLYLRELGADPIVLGAVLSLAALAATAAHMPAGYLADRFGRKTVMLAGWGLGVLSALLMFLAPGLELFVPALIAYTFTGFVIAPINAYVSEARGAQSIQRAITLTSAGYWSGTILSPALGGWIGETYGLRWVYLSACAAFLCSSLAMLLLRPQPIAPASPGRGRYADLLRNGRLVGFLALLFVAMLAIHLGHPFAPNFVEDVRGYNVATIGLLGSANSVGIVALNLIFGQRIPRRGFMLAQGLVALSHVLLLSLAGLPFLFVAYFLRAGLFLARSMAAAQVGRVVDNAQSGLAFGMFESVAGAAQIVGALAAGRLYQSSPGLPFQVSLGLIILTFPLVWLFAPRRDPHSLDEPQPAVKTS